MITGDLVRHNYEDNSFGVITKINVETCTAQILWLDYDYPVIEWYSQLHLNVTSSADLDWENDVVMLEA